MCCFHEKRCNSINHCQKSRFILIFNRPESGGCFGTGVWDCTKSDYLKIFLYFIKMNSCNWVNENIGFSFRLASLIMQRACASLSTYVPIMNQTFWARIHNMFFFSICPHLMNSHTLINQKSHKMAYIILKRSEFSFCQFLVHQYRLKFGLTHLNDDVIYLNNWVLHEHTYYY